MAARCSSSGARFGAGAHGVDVRQRGVHQRRVYPAAGALPGHGLLQQHEAEFVEVVVVALRVFGQVVGGFHHLRQRVGGVAYAGQRVLVDVLGQARNVARYRQSRLPGRGARSGLAWGLGRGCGRVGHGARKVRPTVNPGSHRPGLGPSGR